MKRILALIAFITLLFGTPTAFAAPVASFTLTGEARVGQTVVLDGSASVCDPGYTCGYTWTVTYRNPYTFATVTIARLGYTPVVSYTFTPADATHAYVTFLLKFTENNGTNNFRTAQQSVAVRA